MFYNIKRVSKQGAAKFCYDKFDVFVIMFDDYRQSHIKLSENEMMFLASLVHQSFPRSSV